jgi:hypothetical protein
MYLEYPGLSKLKRLAVAFSVFAAMATVASGAEKSSYLRELDLMSGELLAKVRQNCATGQMPQILAKVRRDNPGEQVPAADTYCVTAMGVSARRNALLDLYINMALQEQGYSELAFAEDAQLLNHDEAGQTAGRVFRAAGSGASSYLSITSKSRVLPCSLAFDAGFTWGYRNPNKPQSYELTEAGAAAIARACYDPSIQAISIAGQTMSAQKAGLYAGAWMGRQQSIGY